MSCYCSGVLKSLRTRQRHKARRCQCCSMNDTDRVYRNDIFASASTEDMHPTVLSEPKLAGSAHNDPPPPTSAASYLLEQQSGFASGRRAKHIRKRNLCSSLSGRRLLCKLPPASVESDLLVPRTTSA